MQGYLQTMNFPRSFQLLQVSEFLPSSSSSSFFLLFSSPPLSIYPPDSPILCRLWISPLIFFIIFFFVFFSSPPLSIYPPDSPILCHLWISLLIFFIIFFLCFFPHLLCQFTQQIHRSFFSLSTNGFHVGNISQYS